MRRARMLVLTGASMLALAACAQSSAEEGRSPGAATHTMADGTVMSGSSMTSDDPSAMPSQDAGSADQASETASMICGDEIRTTVETTFGLGAPPVGLSSFTHRLFRCTYQLHGGDLRLSVKDLDSAGPGQAYFDGLRSRLPGARDLNGLESYGFPAFETPRGDVVFIKDHKTLWVDASRLTAEALPDGFTRTEAAYAVAAAVIACWSE